jgi:hypothetical protein
LKPYDNTFWDFNNGGKKRRARLYSQKSADILPEECGYIPGRVRLYSRKSAVILPGERIYMEEERGYIAGRARLYGGIARLYSGKSAVIFF